MKYTKEQAQMLALLVIMGCAVVVLLFLYLVKPNFAAAADSQKELQKTETEIGKLNHASVVLAKAKSEEESLTATIDRGEKAVFAGMELVSPLSQICVQAGTVLAVKPAYGEQTTEEVLEFSERDEQEGQVLRHYDEVSRTLDVRAVDFLTLCRFLGAVEGANEGLRVTGMKIESSKLEPQVQSQGKVNANLELSLVGVREGTPPDSSALLVNPAEAGLDMAATSARNPFGPPGGLWVPPEDPLVGCRETLRRMKLQGVMGDWLLVEAPAMATGGQPAAQNLRLKKGQTLVIGNVKMKYVEAAGDSFIFEATGHGVRFVAETNYKGEVTTIKEEEVQ